MRTFFEIAFYPKTDSLVTFSSETVVSFEESCALIKDIFSEFSLTPSSIETFGSCPLFSFSLFVVSSELSAFGVGIVKRRSVAAIVSMEPHIRKGRLKPTRMG